MNKSGKSRLKLSDLKGGSNIETPAGLVFYCRSCEQILDIKPKSFDFKRKIDGCQREKAPNRSDEEKKEMDCEIVYGSERSIKRYFKIADERFDRERREREEKAQKADKL